MKKDLKKRSRQFMIFMCNGGNQKVVGPKINILMILSEEQWDSWGEI